MISTRFKAGLMLAFVVVLMQAGTRPPAAGEFHVATGGNDGNPGTKDKPFATLEHARKAVGRLAGEELTESVTVRVHGGTHFLKQTLRFGPDDSGTTEHAITYAGARGSPAVISGGRAISGWRRAAGGCWTVVLPEVKAGKWHFRQLHVNGRRAVRARTGFMHVRAVKRAPGGKALYYHFGPGRLKSWKRLEDVEVMVIGRWEILRRGIVSVEPAAGRLSVTGPERVPHPALAARKGVYAYVENALEELDRPGEWYLDRGTGVLTYLPRPGEDMSRAEVIAPVLHRLVEISGTRKAPVRNIVFRNLHFRHSNWKLPPNGYLGTQACHHVGGEKWNARPRGVVEPAVGWTGAEHCRVLFCSFSALGASGLHLGERCAGNAVVRSSFFDICGNGVMVGIPGWDPGQKKAALVPRNNHVLDNHVRACGAELYGAVGIWAGITQGTRIEHNLVHDLPYTGISVGWDWTPKPTPARGNVIAGNHVHDVMKVLADGGGIYTLGSQPGTVVRGNHIHGLRRGRHAEAGGPVYGLYLDQGSKGFRIEDNVVHDVDKPLRLNRCDRRWHTWKGNTLLAALNTPVLREGVKGKALSCGEAGRGMELPHAPAADPAILTVEAWVKLNRPPQGKDNRRWAVSKNGDEWTAGHYGLLVMGNRAGAYLNIGGGRQNCFLAAAKQPGLKAGKWHHLAMTYDGKTLTVYCDGKPAGRKAVGRGRKPGRGNLTLGDRSDQRRGFVLPGLVDEVRVYRRALSAGEIAARHAAPLKAPPAGCSGHWGFDEGAGIPAAIKAVMDRAGPRPLTRPAGARRPAASEPTGEG